MAKQNVYQSDDFEVRDIPIEEIEPNDWNPNEMSDDKFNRLTEEIENVGYIDPIQVVRLDSGKYRIIGGEHRYKVLEVLGYDVIPCTVLTNEEWKETDLQKFVTLRLNVIKGDVNAQKFVDLYEDLAERYEEEALQTLMGFTDDDVWDELTSDIRTELKESGAPDEVIDKFDEATKEMNTVDDLSTVLNKLFNEYGDTLDHNFMWFTYGSKKHAYVQCDKETWDTAKGFIDAAHEAGADVSAAFGELLEGWEDRIDLSDHEIVEDEEGGDAG